MGEEQSKWMSHYVRLGKLRSTTGAYSGVLKYIQKNFSVSVIGYICVQ